MAAREPTTVGGAWPKFRNGPTVLSNPFMISFSGCSPLRERSGVNPRAPILDEEIIAQFRASRELQKNLMLSFVRMLRFYGLEVRHKPRLRIVQGSIFQERAREWMSPGNHNYLRITRILKSLSSLGLEEEARKFFECLSDIYDQQDKRNVLISPETFQYWKAAVPLPR